MADTEPLMRQALGCGWLPRTTLVRIQPFVHQGDRHEYTTCPGYTTKLPEVKEAAEARMHAKNNMFGAFVRDEPHENLLTAIRVLEAADSDATNWRAPESK
jgi:hypothetical protein